MTDNSDLTIRATNQTGDPAAAPLVSIIIPAYNTAPFIAETLDSVFAQTLSNFEVIVVNDASPDTPDMERALQPYLHRIVYLTQNNRGPAGARNTAIRRARGQFLAFLDSDDSWLPEYLATQLNFFHENPMLDVSYCDAMLFGNPAIHSKTYMQVCPSTGPVTLDSLIQQRSQVITSCTVARTQAILRAGVFDERTDLRGCEDYDLWLRVLYVGGAIGYHRNILGRYRSHPNSLSANALKMYQAIRNVYEKANQQMSLPASTRALLLHQLAKAQANFNLEAGKLSLANGDFTQARRSLASANLFFHRPKLKTTILALQFAPRCTRFAARAWQKAIAIL
jgi:glycosyltransferase involved in cell wall biosynthesis